MPARPGTVPTAFLFGLMVLAWGGNYLFVRVGEGYVPPLWLATLRAGLGTVALGAYLTLRPPKVPFSRADRRDALLLGIPNTAIFLGLWFVAAAQVPPGQAAVLVYTFPLWVALLSPWVLGGRVGPGRWLGIVLGFLGVVLLSQPWATGGQRPPTEAVVELLLAAVSWASATVAFQKRFSPASLPLANGYQLLGGATALLATSAALHEVSGPVAAPALWVSVAWLGLFGTAFAYGVWFFLLRSVPAPSLSAYAFLVPLTALLLSAVFEGERLDWAQLGGVVLVLLGVYRVGRVSAQLPSRRADPAA